MDHRHSSCSCYQVCWPNLLEKSISELSNRCLAVDCSQICKKPTSLSSPVIPPVGKEPPRALRGKEGRKRLLTLIPSFAWAQAELALPEGGHGGCKRHWELLCCVWEGSNCVQTPACDPGNAGYGLFPCLLEEQAVHATNNGTECQQESLGIICGCGNGQVVPPPSSYILLVTRTHTCNMGLQNKARRRNNLCYLSPALKLLS